ncbi:hypothetical protein Acr_17g0005790 [Actinidia rufa]|uniref:Uncharacterized protein n=1 Tax=Actinidia rufa TaxID=165716 RepID=A0A7J0G2J0_9ERIC|nr:hypothetical protein Acr_17g0005790 [Actinidia rufa]
MPSVASGGVKDSTQSNNKPSGTPSKADFFTRKQRIAQQRKSLPIASGIYLLFGCCSHLLSKSAVSFID